VTGATILPFSPDLGLPRLYQGTEELHWHALITYPQRERAGKLWLDRRGVYSFFPVKRQVRMAHGRRIERDSRYLPGYLFAAFPGAPIWYKILGSPFISNAIRGHNGEPGRLHPDSIVSLRAMASVDDEITNQWRVARTPRRGDRVRIKAGVFQGHEYEVVEIVSGNVRLKLQLLGRELDVPLDGVEKVA
jgi:transcription antitermination factor NusG